MAPATGTATLSPVPHALYRIEHSRSVPMPSARLRFPRIRLTASWNPGKRPGALGNSSTSGDAGIAVAFRPDGEQLAAHRMVTSNSVT